MAVKKKAVSKSSAPLSQRPYVTIALLVGLVCALALTIELIQDSQYKEQMARGRQVPVYQITK